MSGTSIDGVDCALVQFIGDQPKLIATHSEPIESGLREDILRLCSGKNIDLELYGNTDVAIGQLFARAAITLLANEEIERTAIRAIGSHGQTIFHHPQGDTRFTLQIGDPNSIAQLCGITTIADFRRRDMADRAVRRAARFVYGCVARMNSTETVQRRKNLVRFARYVKIWLFLFWGSDPLGPYGKIRLVKQASTNAFSAQTVNFGYEMTKICKT